MYKILLLEDDRELAKALCRYLHPFGYEVDWVTNGEEAIDHTYENSYALYLFDINVPFLNGIDLLNQLREAGDHTPAIIISALRDISSITQGFSAGADDYVKKPFDPDELIVRIKAKLKTLHDRIRIGDIEFDPNNECIHRGDTCIFLGRVQSELLKKLLAFKPNPAPKEELLAVLEKPSEPALRVNISKLKKNTGIAIRCIREVGYQIS